MFVVCSVGILSCNKEPLPYLGNSAIIGWVGMQDSFNQKGIRVDAYGPYGKSTAYSDSSGEYVIRNLGNGTYRVEFSKIGFGTFKVYGVQLFGNDTASANGSILQTYESYIFPHLKKVYTSSDFGWDPTEFAIETDQVSGETPVLVFVDDKSSVTCHNFGYVAHGTPLSRNDFNSLLISFYLFPNPFASGSKLYAILYLVNPRDNGYYDPYLCTWVYPTLIESKHSDVISFIMP